MTDQSRASYIHDYDSTHNREYLPGRTAFNEGAFFLPYLKPGMSVLDVGCGPGTITIGLAQAVSPGEVIGVDIEPAQVDTARNHASENKVSNVKFEVADIYALPFSDNSFDAAFGNAILGHLYKPNDAIREIYRVLKPGGVIGLRADDWAGHVYWPTNEIIERGRGIYLAVWERDGRDPYIGRRLRSLLRQGGFDRVEATSSSESWGNAESTRTIGSVLASLFTSGNFASIATKEGLMDRKETDDVAAAFKEWAEHPDALYAHSFIEAVGWKQA